MARKRVVSRTITSTEAKVLCVDITTNATTTVEVDLSGVYKDTKALMKAVRNALETETLKPVHVEATKEVEALYVMPEQQFINLAEKVDKIEAETEEN